jgi:ribosomal protein S18 acetylase RimI-like enzyme
LTKGQTVEGRPAAIGAPDDASPRFRIEPLDPEKHDRGRFSCGVEQVDQYFRKTANKLMQAGNTSVYVMVGPEGDVAGFYAMNAHAVHYEDLPNRYKRTAPGHGSIPAVYISMIGRDERYRGQEIGGDLLVDALCRASRASRSGYAAAVIMLDVLDCGDARKTADRRAIYERFQFQSLPAHPLRMFMPMRTADALREKMGL